MEENVLTPTDFVGIIKRRRWSLILPAVIIFSISALVALLLPAVYKTSSTVLIEEQEIPEDFVQSTITSFADQRIQNINQRIMTSAKLIEIINNFELYPELREKETIDEIIDKLKQDIKLEPISVEVMDRRTGRPGTATIAFSISYEGKDPVKVQKVVTRMTSMFLEEDLQVRERQAKDTSSFLEDEKNKVKKQLDATEAVISAFKEKNIDKLPELFQANLQGLHNIENDIERINERIRSLKERSEYLETQLVSIPKIVDENERRLDELKLQLTHLLSNFTSKHPDVVKTKIEIEKIEKQIKEEGERVKSPLDQPDNPAYITLSSQLAGTKSDLGSLKLQLEDLYVERDKYRKRVESTPKVEEEYNSIIIEKNSLQLKYNDLLRKMMEARVAHGLEKEQKGERFTLIDPARMPEKPYKPNRIAIILIGIVLGVGAGVGAASLIEFSDNSVRNANALFQATAYPVLASIPEIVTEKDRKQKKLKKVSIWATAIVCCLLGIIIFHFFIMDLDVFWAKLSRKFMI